MIRAGVLLPTAGVLVGSSGCGRQVSGSGWGTPGSTVTALNAAATIRNTCGKDPAPLFRFPYGERDSRTISAVNSAGYVAVRWTVDTLGWQGTSEGRSVRSVIARVVAQAQPGEIVLMHVGANPYDNSTLDADALPGMIQALHSMGYAFVNLNTLLTAG